MDPKPLTSTPTTRPLPPQFCSRSTSTQNDDANVNVNPRQIQRATTSTSTEPQIRRSVKQIDSDSEDNDRQMTTSTSKSGDNIFGRLQRGMNIIASHARDSMASCGSEQSLQEETEAGLERSTLVMLKAEKTFVQAPRIISEVVDDAFEEEEEEEGGRVLFRKDLLKSPSIKRLGVRVKEDFHRRFSAYYDGLSEDALRGERKFKDLQTQIRYGKRDAERAALQEMNALSIIVDPLPGGQGDKMPSYDLDEGSSDEDSFYDSSILPCLDPLTKEPIFNAVVNRVCHHVFDRHSLQEFMRQRPRAPCPFEGCGNKGPLRPEDIIPQDRLTTQIRLKNEATYGTDYQLKMHYS